MIISLEAVNKSFGANSILENITAKVEDSDRIGLIGQNGAGKSTLLNIIYNSLEPDSGQIARADKRFGFLRQSSGLSNQNTILSEMRGVFRPLLQTEEELHTLEAQISAMDPASPAYKPLAARYAQLGAYFEQQGGYLIEVRISTILNGMGFLGVDSHTPIAVLSGGEKTRLAICKLLLEAPDLLILDEPTNHLDFKTLLWLEDYLTGYKGALLIVSHDRYFLNRLCGHIWEIEHHRLCAYKGNYSSYVVQKQERWERQQKEYEIQQQEISHLKDFVARNMARASTTARAQSKQKTLDRMDQIERPKSPPLPPKFYFRYKREPVKDVLAVSNLSLSVGEEQERKQLCSGIDFTMLRGEKIALIGANGVGKSSFLKAIQGLLLYDKGEIEWGRGVERSYFEQEEFALDSQKTALDELWDRFPREYEHTIRTVLGNVQLVGENVYKQVGSLSGGERQKLKFAILTLSCGNVLLMDEPTNHLDLAAKEALDAALRNYSGTLLVVSHDRYLLNKIPTKIAEMHPDGIRIYPGNYDNYIQQKNKEAAAKPLEEKAREPEKTQQSEYYRSKKQRSEELARKKRTQELEDAIEALERDILSLEQKLTLPEVAGDYITLQQVCAQLEQARDTLNESLSEWERLCDE